VTRGLDSHLHLDSDGSTPFAPTSSSTPAGASHCQRPPDRSDRLVRIPATLLYQASDGTINSISFTRTTIASFNDKVATFRADEATETQAEQSAAASAFQAEQSAAAASIEATTSCSVEIWENNSGSFFLVVLGPSAPAECRSLTAAVTPTNAAAEFSVGQTEIPASTPHVYVPQVVCSGPINGFSVTIYYDLGIHSPSRDACSSLGLTAH